MKIPGLAKYCVDEILLVTLGCVAATGSIWFISGIFQAPVWRIAIALPVVAWSLGIWFFRDPEREVPTESDILTCPADGVVQDITELEDPSRPGIAMQRLGIFMSPLDVHVNRMPCDSEVIQTTHFPGKFLAAFKVDAIERNERQITLFRPSGDDESDVFQVRQITGAVARRIVCEAQPGKRYKRGERFGMIKFGSRVELWIPVDSPYNWTVKIGDKLKAGSTIIARKPPATNNSDS